MADVKLPLAVLAALVLSGTASLAHAQSASQAAARPQVAFSDPDATAREHYTLNQSQQPTVIELDGKSHWGLKLEIQQPVTRQAQLKDVEAGAFYKITPSIRVGGAVGLTDTKAPAAQTDVTSPVTARLRLGASVKF